MPTAKVGDINIYYEDQGKGEVLLLVPGISLNSTSWFRQIPVFSKEYRVIAVDNRGAGRSDKPDTPYTSTIMAADVAGLLDVINIDVVHIFGVSMGGCIAQQFALNYPKKVQTLILGCTTCGGSRRIVGPSQTPFDATFNPEHLRNLTPKDLFYEAASFTFAQGTRFIEGNPAIIEQYFTESMRYPAPSYAMFRQRKAVEDNDTYDRLPEIKVPTLVIVGDSDTLIPVENSQLLASRIPNSALVVLKNAGHVFFIDAAEEANKIVLSFLHKHGRSG